MATILLSITTEKVFIESKKCINKAVKFLLLCVLITICNTIRERNIQYEKYKIYDKCKSYTKIYRKCDSKNQCTVVNYSRICGFIYEKG